MNRFRRWLLKLVMFEIAVVKIEPGDTVVFKTPFSLTMTEKDDIYIEMTKVFPVYILFIPDDASIEIIKNAGGDNEKNKTL